MVCIVQMAQTAQTVIPGETLAKWILVEPNFGSILVLRVTDELPARAGAGVR